MKKSGTLTRRQFVARAAALTAGATLVGALPSFAQTAETVCGVETLKKIGEIVSRKGKLKGVLKIKNGPKKMPGLKTGVQPPMMRYFEGYDQQVTKPPVWPEDKQGCFPGPTLRVSVGERVELTFLNQTDVGAFPGGTLDNAETGATTGCDQATNATVAGQAPIKDWYPRVRGDSFPNCFHGSSTSNLHFHGAHVTPSGFGDNVLVQLRPDPRITEEDVKDIFEEIFTQCAAEEAPPAWKRVPESFRTWQERAVKDYDLHAIWKGVRGPVKDPVTGANVPALPVANQLWPSNEANIAAGLWPQYFIGGFPNCFTIPKAEGHVMGQAPGTYWYHSHKHGSTSINLYNGLSGAMIIEGDYDADLAKIYGPSLKQNEKVLVFQVFEDLPDLERPRASRGNKPGMMNGTQVVAAANGVAQKGPTIVMRPGEIQLWRIVNAQVANNIAGSFSGPAGAAISPLPAFRQIAQDGVQFHLTNYNTQPLTTQNTTTKDGTKFTLPAGGRIDILVKAPALAEGTTSQSYELAGVVNLIVCGDPFTPDPAYPNGGAFPTDDNYPKFPDFLGDIGPCRIQRTLSFDWEPFRIQPGEASTTTHQLPPGVTKMPFPVKVGDGHGGTKKITIDTDRAPYFMIDNEQFSEHKYYQTMVLGDNEEWKILNTTKVPHPFHIHVNPFQVVESYDPNTTTGNYVREQRGVWQDNVIIPSALKDANGNLVIDPKTGLATVPGYIRIRSRFVDFPGTYVLHCHILAHEDRGMMQLVRVIDGATTIKHH